MATNQSKLPSAVCLSIVGEPGEVPATARATLQQLLDANPKLPKPDLNLPVGNGMVLCFDYPTRTLEFVRHLGASLRAAGWPLPPLQMGVHIATMSRSADMPEATLSGGSIDGAARAARLAQPNQAIATSQFQTLVVQMLKIDQGHFVHLGRRTGTDGKSIDAYEIPPFATAPAPAAAAAPGKPLAAELVSEAERLLADEIGPLAKMLTQRTAAAKADSAAFIQALAESIPDPLRRSAFIAVMNAFAADT